jgi:hypothetical protein
MQERHEGEDHRSNGASKGKRAKEFNALDCLSMDAIQWSPESRPAGQFEEEAYWMHPILLGIVLAVTPSLLAVIWLSWRAKILNSSRNESAPRRRRQKKHVADELDPGSATEFPIAPEVTGAATPVRRSRRRVAARA